MRSRVFGGVHGRVALATSLLVARAGHAAVPDRVWGTYYGGTGDDVVYDLAIDAAGNTYAVGTTVSPEGIATAGAFDESVSGQDGFLVKFGPDGQRVWGTYIGGGGLDGSYSLDVRGDMVVVGGLTYPPTDIGTPGTFKPDPFDDDNGGYVARFTPAGALVWATYTGRGVEGLAIDANQDIYAAGTVGLTHDIATPGAFQETSNGAVEAFVIRLDGAGQRVWGTLFGGSQADFVSDLALGPGGAVYLAGATFSTANIATANAHQTAFGGFIDAYLVRFDTSGARLWATYLGGPGEDSSPSVVAIPGGVVLGVTTSDPGLATPGTHSTVVDGDDGLVTRFDDAGVRAWATYIGGPGDQFSVNVAVDGDLNLFVGGVTPASPGIATTKAFQTTFGGAPRDVFLARLDGVGQRVWGTYVGGPKNDAVGVVAVGDRRIAIAGLTASETGVASPGGHQTAIAGEDDAMIVQFTELFLQGNPCNTSGECLTGICVDSVCCDAGCGGDPDDCMACSVAAGAEVDGTCGAAIAKVCRPAAGDCDVAETCASDSLCPDDEIAEDGAPCKGNGMCASGVCEPDAGTTTTTGDTTTDTGSTSDTGSTDDTKTTSDTGSTDDTRTTSDGSTDDTTSGVSGSTGGTSTGGTSTDASSSSGAPPDDPFIPTEGTPTGGETSGPGSDSTGDAVDTAGGGCRVGAGDPTWGAGALVLLAWPRRRRARR